MQIWWLIAFPFELHYLSDFLGNMFFLLKSVYCCCIMQRHCFPSTGGKEFNTRQQAKTCWMRHATSKHVAPVAYGMLHVASCWTSGIPPLICNSVACHMLPQCNTALRWNMYLEFRTKPICSNGAIHIRQHWGKKHFAHLTCSISPHGRNTIPPVQQEATCSMHMHGMLQRATCCPVGCRMLRDLTRCLVLNGSPPVQWWDGFNVTAATT